MSPVPVTIAAIIIAVIASAGIWGPAYNEHLSPLGRLHSDLAIGDPYDAILEKFEAYKAGHDYSGSPMQFNSGTTETDFDHNPIEESEFLFIYDQSLIGDVQLGVLFDDSRRLKETYFLGD